MKKLFVKGIIFLALIILTDILVGLVGKFIMQKLNEGNYSGKVAMECYNINYAKPDIAIIGSSPTLTGCIPKILKDSIFEEVGREYDVRNVSCYVQGMPYYVAELKSLIKRKTPKVIILDIDPSHLSVFEDNLNVLRSFAISNGEIKSLMMSRADNIDRLLLHSNAYCLNTDFFSLLYGFTTSKGGDGYCPNFNQLKVVPRGSVNKSFVDSTNQALFNEFIRMARDHNVHVIIVTSPSCINYSKDCDTYREIIDVCKKNNIMYYDFIHDSISYCDDLFADDTHLNDEGAHVFTSLLYSRIKSELLEVLKSK